MPASAVLEGATYAAIEHAGAWRIARASDGAWVGRASSTGRFGPEVREWQAKDAADRFLDYLNKGQPIATTHLAWIATAVEEDAQQCPPELEVPTG